MSTQEINNQVTSDAAYPALLRSASERLVPLSALLELTYRCNLSCRHCYLHLFPSSPTGDRVPIELNASEWKKVLCELADNGSLFLTLTGGEPLLSPEFFRICEIAREKRFVLRIFTNGTLVNREIASRLASLHPLEVEVSLYAAQADIHDWFTRTPGSLVSSLRGITLLMDQGVRVNLKTPALTCNYKEIGPLKRLAETMGIPIFFSFVLSPRDNGESSPLEFQLNSKEILSCLPEIGLSGTQFTQELPAPGPDDPICGAGRNSVAISPSGEVFPCVQIRRSAGMVRSDSFSHIWKSSPKLGEIRKYTLSQLSRCHICPHLGSCAICPGMSLALNQDFRIPYWPSCEVTKAWTRFKKESSPSPCKHV